MKTVIILSMLMAGSISLVIKQKDVDRNPCDDCNGTFCYCDSKCGQGEVLTCRCGVFSCLCWCQPVDERQGPILQMPVVNPEQIDNSKKAEEYFLNLGTSQADEISRGIKDLRNAIMEDDLNAYQTIAYQVELAYGSLPSNQKTAFENWLSQNTK